MITLSRLTVSQREAWEQRRDNACRRYNISPDVFETLCQCEHMLSTWHERECNGEIERDEPSDRWPLGRPSRWIENHNGERIPCGYVPDRAMAAMRRAKHALAGASDVALYWQTDPRGCAIYLYQPSECLARGGEITACYSNIGTPCYF